MASPRNVILVAVVVAPACVSDGERVAADTSERADVAEVVADPCAEAGARECVSPEVARRCADGAWIEDTCPEGQSCTRATGTCSTGTLSCFGTLVCNIDCVEGDAECPRACSSQATVPAVDALGDLNDCQCEEDCWPILCGRLFPWPGYGEISACVAATCADEAATCAGGGATGDAGCLVVRDCLLACEGDVFCAEGCFAQGTAQAQTTAAFYYICVRDACGPAPTPTCLFDAQADRCADLWNTCQGEVVAPGDGGSR